MIQGGEIIVVYSIDWSMTFQKFQDLKRARFQSMYETVAPNYILTIFKQKDKHEILQELKQ